LPFRAVERTEARKDTPAGSYERHLQTKAGEVTLKVPKLRNLPFETAIIERCRRQESSVEEALVEMDLAGVSVRRVEDITEALWGTRVSPSKVSELDQKIYAQIEAWRNRPIEGNHPYVFLDGLWLKRNWGGEVRNVSLLVAIGVNDEGFREVLAVAEGSKKDKASWTAFLRHLKERGLKGVQLFVSDKCLGLVESLGEFYPKAFWQRCAVGLLKNVHIQWPKKAGTVRLSSVLETLHSSYLIHAANRLRLITLAVMYTWISILASPRRIAR
jgi:putative transposase